MIRGTTAQFKFKLPHTKSEIQSATIRFWQSNNPNKYLPIIKTLDSEKLNDCFISDDSKELCISLTSEETARFSDKYKAKTQLRGVLVDGGTFGSRPQIITVYPMPDDIINPTMPPVDDEGWIVLDGETVSV